MCGLDNKSAAEQPTRSDGAITVLGTLVGAPIHFTACAITSLQLFRLASGISTSGRFTMYGGIDYAWTNIAWLPGGLLLGIGDGGPARPAPLFLPALLLLFLGSLGAAYLSATVIGKTLHRTRNYGRWNWQVWACLLVWLGWLPVPVRMTLTYWHTVAY